MARVPAFQAGHAGSIPVTRSDRDPCRGRGPAATGPWATAPPDPAGDGDAATLPARVTTAGAGRGGKEAAGPGALTNAGWSGRVDVAG